VEPIQRLQIKIRLARIAAKKTQSEIAKNLGVSLRTYQRLEAGKAPLDVETLYKLSALYQMSFLTLTSPEIQKEECHGIQFYSCKKELFSRPEVDEEILSKVVQHFTKDSQPDQGFRVSSNSLIRSPEFNHYSRPLFISDLKTTVANKELIKKTEESPSSPWEFSKNLVSLACYIKAIEVALREQFAGFLLEGQSKNGHKEKHLNLILNASQGNILLIGKALA
jgi:transcriptional regulator with XRE-family HTH domain